MDWGQSKLQSVLIGESGGVDRLSSSFSVFQVHLDLSLEFGKMVKREYTGSRTTGISPFRVWKPRCGQNDFLPLGTQGDPEGGDTGGCHSLHSSQLGTSPFPKKVWAVASMSATVAQKPRHHLGHDQKSRISSPIRDILRQDRQSNKISRWFVIQGVRSTEFDPRNKKKVV